MTSRRKAIQGGRKQSSFKKKIGGFYKHKISNSSIYVITKKFQHQKLPPVGFELATEYNVLPTELIWNLLTEFYMQHSTKESIGFIRVFPYYTKLASLYNF